MKQIRMTRRLPTTVDELRGLRAARWTRESTEEQFDKYGPGTQRQSQDRALHSLGLIDTGLSWSAAESGSTVYDHASMREMLDAARAAQFDVLLVAYVDRWQRNLRQLNTDEPKEVDMAMEVFSIDLKTWIPSSEHTEYILGMQGSSIANTNGDGHIRVLPDYRQADLAFTGWVKHTHANNLSVQAGIRWEYRHFDAPEQEKASHSHGEEQGEEGNEEIMPALYRTYQNLSFSLGSTWEINHARA